MKGRLGVTLQDFAQGEPVGGGPPGAWPDSCLHPNTRCRCHRQAEVGNVRPGARALPRGSFSGWVGGWVVERIKAHRTGAFGL